MLVALRIVLVCIITLIFIGMSFFTFFQSPQYLSIPDISQPQDVFNTGGISSFSVSNFGSVYTSGEQSPEIQKISDKSYNISVSDPGKILTSFRSIGEKYSFSGTGFVLNQEGVGEIFIDTYSTPGKIFIYTLNTPATLQLIDDETGEKYVDIHLTPHMYIEFQASRGRYLKNADRIRIGTVFQLGYISANINSGKDALIYEKYLNSQDGFLEKIKNKIEKRDLILQSQLGDFSQQKVSQIPGQDSMQRYMNIFVNNEKKIVFYKNKILEGYLKILNNDVIDTKILTQLQKDLQSLKSLSIESYTELKEYEFEIMRALESTMQEKFMAAKILFSSLGDEDDSQSHDVLYFILYSFSLFNNYDKTGIFSYELSRNFLEYFPSYVKDLALSDEQSNLRYDYFLYFLEKQLLSLLNSENNDQEISSIIVTLENYVEIIQQDYNYSLTDKVSRLFVLSNIFQKIEIFFREKYFLAQRDENKILQLDTQNTITVSDVIKMQGYINNLYTIYDKDKKHLNISSSRDAEIIKSIDASRVKIEEYFSALENFETYKSLYDVSKTNLLSLDTFSSQDDQSLSREKIYDYISQFTGVSLRSVEINIIDNLYYHVSNLNISGKVFEFNIFPAPEYKMTNIFIDNDPKPIQYKLGNIEYEWGEEYKTAALEEKDKYDFSRFFLLTFFSGDERSVEEYVNVVKTGEEDKTEVVFKKDILLGNPGEFTILENILDIEYDDIRLEKQGQNYDIYLEDVMVDISVIAENGGNERYRGLLESEYVLSETDHYFIDSSLNIYKKQENIKNGFMLNGEKIYILGKTHISDMQKMLEDLISQVSLYNSVQLEIASIGEYKNMVFQYTHALNKMSIKFDSLGKKYTILLRGNRIEGIYQGSQKIASGDISLSDIKKYIK